MTALKALLLGTALTTAAATAIPSAAEAAKRSAAAASYQHVLLLSIDGLHASDLTAWLQYGPATSALKTLSQTGVMFMNAYTTSPSNDFPGLLSMVTGGTPLSTGVYYDDSYDRLLFAPTSGCAGNPGSEVNYTKFVDVNSTQLNAGGTLGQPLTQIDASKLPRQLSGSTCAPVLPHQFLRANTVFDLIKASALSSKRTAWADQHPSYEIIEGASGTSVDDLYTPEINAIADQASNSDYTQSYTAAQVYDHKKVQAVINEIQGSSSTGTTGVGVPVVFGTNFASVSVGQRLASSGPLDPAGLVGGYKVPTNATKAPWNNALLGQISFVDGQIGQIVTALQQNGLTASTLVIVTAKFGQSPIAPNTRIAVSPARYVSDIKPAFGVYDDVALLWLDPNTRTVNNYNALLANFVHYSTLALHIDTFLSKNDLEREFVSPFTDNRVPDFISLPFPGVVYTTTSLLADHGGFDDDDQNVALMLSSPSLPQAQATEPVETRQIAPTILQALGLDYTKLQAYAKEGTRPFFNTLP